MCPLLPSLCRGSLAAGLRRQHKLFSAFTAKVSAEPRGKQSAANPAAARRREWAVTSARMARGLSWELATQPVHPRAASQRRLPAWEKTGIGPGPHSIILPVTETERKSRPSYQEPGKSQLGWKIRQPTGILQKWLGGWNGRESKSSHHEEAQEAITNPFETNKIETLSKETEVIFLKPNGNLKTEKYNNQEKASQDGPNRRVEMTKDRISKLEARAIKFPSLNTNIK